MRENDTRANSTIPHETPTVKGFQRIVPLKALKLYSDFGDGQPVKMIFPR